MYVHTVKRPDGCVIANGPNGTEERDTKQCCHCGKHFDVVKGSGKIRGKCFLCDSKGDKWTCGAAECNEHFPIEKRLDLYEKGLLPEMTSSLDTILPTYKRIIR